MYVETDFILALLKEDDWLQKAAEKIYNERKEELWTSKHTLVELMLIGYRNNWQVDQAIANATDLVEIEQNTEDIEAAAFFVSEENMTPFDALHLVKSEGEKIVSSDKSYDQHTKRLKLEEIAEDNKK